MRGSADQLSDGNGRDSEARTGETFRILLQEVGLCLAHGLSLGRDLSLTYCWRWQDPLPASVLATGEAGCVTLGQCEGNSS